RGFTCGSTICAFISEIQDPWLGRGDRTEAAQSSRLARNLNNVALGVGLVVIFSVIIYAYLLPLLIYW
uniref:Uncharacterized protein n=1 Tax=Neogobius melanostomus TaxID=47308 RepID=A0A8C6SCU4_9GOBI